MAVDLGTDFYCDDDITEDWQITDDRTAFLQACYRRLVMRGLFYARDYGLGFFRYLLEGGVTQAEIDSAIARELLKDERTKSVTTAVTEQTVTVYVTPKGATQPLTLTIDRVKGALIDASIN